MKFNHKEIEEKWIQEWKKGDIYQTPKIKQGDNKKYILDMFPYPSGTAMHVGHAEGYIGTDILSRFYRMQGLSVMHPMGWDAFGLPAENFAIKTGTPPRINTDKAIETFKEQLDVLGLSYDWSKEIGSHRENYYKWTQWFFSLLYKKGLAYKKEAPVNWCPKDQTVLANEQVVNGLCERCDTPVVQKNMSQWFFKITHYADRLIKDLDKVDWPESTKINQINWIGKSEGAEVDFKIKGVDEKIRIFTTRLDTIYGATFMVLSPEHKLLEKIVTPDKQAEVTKYQDDSKHKTELERTSEKEKTGVFTGSYAINPYNGKEIPIWVGDFVISSYGTGALMAVPAHDERDYEFAKKYNLEIITVIAKHIGTKREDSTNRKVAYGVIYDISTKKYGFQVWRSDDNCPAIAGGGLDENESFEEGLKREIKEETGITHFEKIYSLGKLFSTHWSLNKNKCIYNEIETYLITVNNPQISEISMESYEKDKLEFIWGEAKEFFDYAKKTTYTVKEYIETNETVMRKAVKFAVENGIDQKQENLEFASGIEKDYGILINSEEFNGLTSEEAFDKFVSIAEEKGFGNKKINYKLRDWLVSRQRYWGAPIPIVYDPEGNAHIVEDKDLPVILPDDVEFTPTGESPLKYHKGFLESAESKYGKGWRREEDTMDTFVDSSWYFFRFCDPNNDKVFASREEVDKWAPVDIYVGGAEHTVLHLMYARFFTKVLFDEGYIGFDEPFIKLRHPGMILGEDSRKMSKRWGNVIDPRTVDEELGIDTLRIYEMFMGPFDQMKPWSTTTIQGARRFLDKVYSLKDSLSDVEDNDVEVQINKLIKKIGEDIVDFKFNTAVASCMKFINLVIEKKKITKDQWKKFILILAPFAPFISEQLWQEINEYKEFSNKNSVHMQTWPKYDESKIQDEKFFIRIQVNGKIRGEIEVSSDEDEQSIKTRSVENVQKWIDGKEIQKFLYIKGKIVSIVV